jgi:tight adherence protein C
MSGMVMAGALSALSAAMLIRWLAPPPARLARRVRPYSHTTRAGYGVASELNSSSTSGWRQVWQAALRPFVRRFSRLLDRDGGAATHLRLRQTGLFQGLDDQQMLEAYRFRQLSALGIATAAAVAIATLFDLPTPRAVGLVGLALVGATTRNRGQVDKAIRKRQEVMRIEIYTVNQLLAMRVRAGGGVVHAVQQIVERGQGEVVTELAEALRLHRAGMRAAAAFARIAAITPEASCARTYALLAAADERGADLAEALLELSEDVRETRRETMRRSATKRRAAMLVPIIGILAPVMLLFVGAPLPRILFNWQ